MSDRNANDFWDRLILAPETSGYPANADERTILAIERLFPNPANPEVRARARQRIFEPPTALPILDSRPALRSGFAYSNVGRQRENQIFPAGRSWSLIAAALLLVLLTSGILLGYARGSLPFLQSDGDGGVIPAVSDQPVDVPMRGINPGRTNVAPGPGVSETPAVSWSFSVRGNVRTSPLVVGGVVYFGQSAASPADPGSIMAVKAGDGSLIWSSPTEHGLTAAFVFDAGTLFAIDDNGVVYALDARTGVERWRKQLRGDDAYKLTWYGALLLADDRLIVSSGSALPVSASDRAVFVGHPAQDWIEGDPHAYALSPDDGSVLWDVQGFPNNDTGGVIALSLSDGSLLWSHEGQPVYLAPSYSDGVIYYGDSTPTALVAIDAATGQERWRTELSPDLTWDGLGSPSITRDAIVVGMMSGDLVAVDRESGKKLWEKHIFSDLSLWVTQSSVMISGNVAVVLGNGAIAAVDLTNQSLLWHLMLQFEATIPANPVMFEKTIFLPAVDPSNDSGALIALAAPTESP